MCCSLSSPKHKRMWNSKSGLPHWSCSKRRPYCNIWHTQLWSNWRLFWRKTTRTTRQQQFVSWQTSSRTTNNNHTSFRGPIPSSRTNCWCDCTSFSNRGLNFWWNLIRSSRKLNTRNSWVTHIRTHSTIRIMSCNLKWRRTRRRRTSDWISIVFLLWLTFRRS